MSAVLVAYASKYGSTREVAVMTTYHVVNVGLERVPGLQYHPYYGE